MAFCHGRTGVCPTQGDCGRENPSLSRAAKGQALVADIGPGCLCGQSQRSRWGHSVSVLFKENQEQNKKRCWIYMLKGADVGSINLGLLGGEKKK